MKEKLRQFMTGRYGMDAFGQFLNLAILVCLVVSLFLGNIFVMLGMLLVIYSSYRMFSRDLQRRREENRKYLRYQGAVKRWFSTRKQRFAQRGEYRYFKCPGCQQDLRVPKGKGEVTITCPKCNTRFEKKS